MSKVFHKISFVLELTNTYTRNPVTDTSLKVILENGTMAMVKPGGFYIFTNLEYGQYTVYIEGKYYQNKKIVIDYSETGSDTYHVDIMPNTLFFGMQSITTIEGYVKQLDTNQTETISVLVQEKAKRVRLKKEGKKGDSYVTFLDTRELLTNRKLGAIVEIEEKENLVVLELGSLEHQGYQLRRELACDMGRSSAHFYSVYTVQIQLDGKFYIPIPMESVDKIQGVIWKNENDASYRKMKINKGKINEVTI